MAELFPPMVSAVSPLEPPSRSYGLPHESKEIVCEEFDPFGRLTVSESSPGRVAFFAAFASLKSQYRLPVNCIPQSESLFMLLIWAYRRWDFIFSTCALSSISFVDTTRVTATAPIMPRIIRTAITSINVKPLCRSFWKRKLNKLFNSILHLHQTCQLPVQRQETCPRIFRYVLMRNRDCYRGKNKVEEIDY